MFYCSTVSTIVLELQAPAPFLRSVTFSERLPPKTLSVGQVQHLAAPSVVVAGANLDYVRPPIIFARRVHLEMVHVIRNKPVVMPKQVVRPPQPRLQLQLPLLQQLPPRVVAVGHRIRASTRTL